MLIMIEEPVDSIQELMARMEDFGRVEGLKVNKEKTTVMVKNLDEQGEINTREEWSSNCKKSKISWNSNNNEKY